MNEKDKQNPSYFSILTPEVRYDKNLSANEKILFSEITCLCNSKGYCYCSNSYFASLYSVSNRTIQSWLSHLTTRGYIKVSYDPKTNERKIFLIINNTKNVNTLNAKKHNARKEKNNTMVNAFVDSII